MKLVDSESEVSRDDIVDYRRSMIANSFQHFHMGGGFSICFRDISDEIEAVRLWVSLGRPVYSRFARSFVVQELGSSASEFRGFRDRIPRNYCPTHSLLLPSERYRLASSCPVCKLMRAGMTLEMALSSAKQNRA